MCKSIYCVYMCMCKSQKVSCLNIFTIFSHCGVDNRQLIGNWVCENELRGVTKECTEYWTTSPSSRNNFRMAWNRNGSWNSLTPPSSHSLAPTSKYTRGTNSEKKKSQLHMAKYSKYTRQLTFWKFVTGYAWRMIFMLKTAVTARRTLWWFPSTPSCPQATASAAGNNDFLCK